METAVGSIDSTEATRRRQRRRKLLRQLASGIVFALLLGGLTGWLLEDWIGRTGAAFLHHFGDWGLVGGVVFLDTSPLPMTNEPLLVLALGGGMPFAKLLLLASLASAAAGIVGYTCGSIVDRVSPIRAWLSEKSPEAAQWIERRGAFGVAVAALLPIPFSLATWTAGAMRVPFFKVAAASLLRVPKTAFYLSLIFAGMTAGAGG